MTLRIDGVERAFLRVAELAKRWGVSKKSIQRGIDSGKTPVESPLGQRVQLIPAEWIEQEETAWQKKRS